ncbi:MAG: glycogen-binding domain-containing protein [Elusimicrobia bacterium]|nr:glycogen-binding domain-containing protein [Elusimicrobiota bacterium]
MLRKVFLWGGFVLGIIIVSFPSFILIERIRGFNEIKLKKTEKKRPLSEAEAVKKEKSKVEKKISYPIKTDKGVKFQYKSSTAKKVSVAGTFNNWDGKKGKMSKNAQGIWEAVIPIKPGKYTYKLKADGVWFLDPINPASANDGKGGRVSVLIVE